MLTVDSKGLEATDEVYDDMNPDQIETLPDSQPHRDVDLEIINADKQGWYLAMSSASSLMSNDLQAT